LDVIRVAGGTSSQKAAGIVTAFSGIWHGLILDVGCRNKELREALDGRSVRYLGLDVKPPADVIADLNHEIPLPDGEADTVVALDVLEHVDAIYDAFAELCRVARRHVVISLPNAFVLDSRYRHLRGRVSGKYGLPEEPPGDRHRWLFSLDDARRFCRHRAKMAGWCVAEEAVLVGPRRQRMEALVRALPNLLSPRLVTHLVPGVHTPPPVPSP
jgi:Methyltransferase domain